MAFVNEFISDEDRQKYGLDELTKPGSGWSNQGDWTIDHERNIYLREVGHSRVDDGAVRPSFTWHFYWKGELLWVCTEVEAAGSDGNPNGHAWARERVVDCFNRGYFIPRHLLAQRDQIVADLTEAFQKYGGGGVYSKHASYELTLII